MILHVNDFIVSAPRIDGDVVAFLGAEDWGLLGPFTDPPSPRPNPGRLIALTLERIMARKTTTAKTVSRVEMLQGLFLAWTEATGKVASIVAQIGELAPITHEEFISAALPEWIEDSKDGTKKLSGAGRIAKMRINKALQSQGVAVGIMPSKKAAESNGNKPKSDTSAKEEKGGRPPKVGKEERHAVSVALHRLEKFAAFIPQDKLGEFKTLLEAVKSALKLS